MNRSSLHPGRDGQESSFLYFSTAFVYQKLTLTETTDCSWRSLHFSRCTLRPRSIFFSLLHQRKILENTKEKQERVKKKMERREREKMATNFVGEDGGRECFSLFGWYPVTCLTVVWMSEKSYSLIQKFKEFTWATLARSFFILSGFHYPMWNDHTEVCELFCWA